MSVVLVGLVDESVAVVGLYEDEEAARRAVHARDVPVGPRYAIFTPDMNGWVASKALAPPSMRQ